MPTTSKSTFKLLFKISIFIVVFCQLSYGQTDKNINISNLPYYNFGKGVGLTSPDSVFQFNIRFRIQNRITYINNEDQDVAFDGQIRRLRLRFDGFVGNPKFLYVLQLSFAPGDVGEIEDGSNLNVIRDAVVYYRHNQHWNFGFGQTKLPGNRQRVNSSGALQLSDRTINNSRFNIDRDFGLFVNHIHEYKDDFSWNIKSTITTGDGRNFTKSPDDGLAYTGKLEIMPLGRFQRDGIYFEGDLVREPSPKIMFSGTYHYNQRAKRLSGVLGEVLAEPRDLSSILLDALLKYNGYAISASYMNRNTDNPIVKGADGKQLVIYKGQGFDVQSSYLFHNHWEIIGRYSHLTPDASIHNSLPKQEQYTIGLTKYIWEHAFKLQLEATVDQLHFSNQTEKTNMYMRFQVEMGI